METRADESLRSCKLCNRASLEICTRECRRKISKREANGLKLQKKKKRISGTKIRIEYSHEYIDRLGPLRLAAGNCIDTGRWQSFPVLYFIARTLLRSAHPVKHSHAWKCTLVILTMSSYPSIPVAAPSSYCLNLSLSLRDDDILYDCRTIDLKRYESACLFFYAKST